MKKRHTPHPAAIPNPTALPDPSGAPVTSPDVLSQACACCGAILPAPLSRLDAIPGQEHLRRAVTVALTGNHPICPRWEDFPAHSDSIRMNKTRSHE
jgi:hypothetical protein